ncbi:hypothetical protein [Salinisphaera sp. T31B1]|uniref:hypothetical protein n=1 Tax=Salinisphaera sp. T31B1 TaxID=727963 RepID=UPI003340757A
MLGDIAVCAATYSDVHMQRIAAEIGNAVFRAPAVPPQPAVEMVAGTPEELAACRLLIAAMRHGTADITFDSADRSLLLTMRNHAGMAIDESSAGDLHNINRLRAQIDRQIANAQPEARHA